MNKGKFEAARNEAEGIFDKLGLLENRNPFPLYPPDMPSLVRRLPYREMWERSLQSGWFDLRLTDQSIIQFKLKPNPSYSYLDTPLVALSFEEFALQQYGEDWPVVAYEIREEYDQYLLSSARERPVTPIRYDYDVELYDEGRHPAGHIHFGLDTNIRVCVTKIMNPISFSLFIIRQCYPLAWQQLTGDAAHVTLFREVRETLEDVPPKFLKGKDHHELQLR